MCLAKVYLEKADTKNIYMENVLEFETDNDMVTLTDIFGRQSRIAGYIEFSNFSSGEVILHVNERSSKQST